MSEQNTKLEIKDNVTLDELNLAFKANEITGLGVINDASGKATALVTYGTDENEPVHRIELAHG